MLDEEGKAIGRISFGDREEEIAVEASLNGSRVDYWIIRDESRSNLNAIPKFFDHLKEKGEHRVSHRIYTDLTSEQRTALYKSAYLTMFYAFGYPYILGSSTDPLEEQINNSDQEVIPDIGVIPMSGVPEVFHPPTISLLIDPIKAYYVFLPIEVEGTSKFYGLILPGPKEDPDVFVDKLENLSYKSLQANSSFEGFYNVPKRSTLALTEGFGVAAAHVLWNQPPNNQQIR